MAASESEIKNRKRDDFRESCSMCLEPYAVSGRTPKLLPCFHTFCIPCLTTLAESVTSKKGLTTPPLTQSASVEKLGSQGQGAEVNSSLEDHPPSEDEDLEEDEAEDEDSENETAKSCGGDKVVKEDRREEEGGMSCAADSNTKPTFQCPTCRAAVTVPSAGVSGLQTNFYIAMEPEEAAQPMLCEVCDEEEEEGKKEAEYICNKCQQRMCRACRRLHDKFVDKKEHQVKPLYLQEKVLSSRQKAELKKCQVHQDQELFLFCLDCDAAICVVCKLSSHQSHGTEDMAAAAQRAKEEMGTMVSTAKEQIQVLQRRLTRLSRDTKELSRQQQEAEHEVKTCCNQLIRWTKRVRDELLESVSAQAKQALCDLQAEETSAHDLINSLCGLVTHAASARDSAEVLLLKNELQSTLLEEEEFEEHKQQSEREEHEEFLHLKGDSSAVDLDIVRAYFGELSTRDEEHVLDASLDYSE